MRPTLTFQQEPKWRNRFPPPSERIAKDIVDIPYSETCDKDRRSGDHQTIDVASCGMLVSWRKAILEQVDASRRACNLNQRKGELMVDGIGHGDAVMKKKHQLGYP